MANTTSAVEFPYTIRKFDMSSTNEGFPIGVNSIAATKDGGYIITGGSNWRLFLLKLLPDGTEDWSREYDDNDIPYPLATHYGAQAQQTKDDGYVVAGSIHYEGHDNLLIIKTDDTGEIIDPIIHEPLDITGGSTNHNFGNSIQQTSDGGYLIAGKCHFVYNGEPCDRGFLSKRYPGLTEKWTRLPCIHNGIAVGAIERHSGEYLVLCDVEPFDHSDPYISLTKYDREGNSGDPQLYQIPDFKARSLQPTHDGGFIISGVHEVDPSHHTWEMRLVKIDANLVKEWDKPIGGNFTSGDGQGYRTQAFQMRNGGYIALGTNQANGKSHMYLVETDTEGASIFDASYGDGIDKYTGSCFCKKNRGGYMAVGSRQYANTPSVFTNRFVDIGVYDAKVVGVSAPGSVRGGNRFTADITMKNMGTSTWVSDLFMFGLVGQGAEDFGNAKSGLPHGVRVRRGQAHTFSLDLWAPFGGGRFKLDYRMGVYSEFGFSRMDLIFGDLATFDVDVEQTHPPTPPN